MGYMLSVIKSRSALLPHSAIQERNNLPTGIGRVRREVAAARSAGNLILYRSRYSLRILRIGGSIGVAGVCGRRGVSCRFLQVFHSHGAGTIGVCSEVRTGHQALFSGHRDAL